MIEIEELGENELERWLAVGNAVRPGDPLTPAMMIDWCSQADSMIWLLATIDAKLSLSEALPDVAFHDITGVKRAWRGRGIAGALKRAEIAWAIDSGYSALRTSNEGRNAPIRALNERYGYVVEPGEIRVRGMLNAAP